MAGARLDAVSQATAVLAAALGATRRPALPSSAAQRAEIRDRALADVFLKGLGPPTAPRVEWVDVVEPDAPFRVRKGRLEAYPNYWVPALLYEPMTSRTGRLTAVLDAGGHHDAGVAAPYRQIRCANLARRGVVVLSYEFVGMGELGGDSDLDPTLGASLHFNIATHELVGIGAPALMYRVMRAALDVLADQPDVDPARIAMTGLSGGGWQTIVLAALDERIAAAVPVAGYTTISARAGCEADVGDLEQVPADMATIVDYDELTAMLAPRPALLIYNERDDCCFQTERVRPVVFDPVVPVYQAHDAVDSFALHSGSKPGDHNYGPDNRRQLYRFLRTHLGVDGPDDDGHVPGEVYPEHRLHVGLPATQTTVREIARRRARGLRTSGIRAAQPAERRRRLAAVLRLPTDVVAAPLEHETVDVAIGSWTLPIAVRGSASAEPTLAIADDGATHRAPHPGASWCGVDLLGTGSMKLPPYLVAMLSCAGIRLLGLQVGHTIALADALARPASHRVDLQADGVVTSVVALLAAALRPDAFRAVTVVGHALSSLEDLISRGTRYAEAAALFCPDLLTVIDLDNAIDLLDDVAWSQESRGGTSYPR